MRRQATGVDAESVYDAHLAPVFRPTMKRFADLVIAAVLLFAMLPLWLLIALSIRLESAGPVLARPHRVGRNGRMIKVHEFRTSIAEPDAMETVGGCHGEQVTRVGALLRKTGLARWPLLLNVLTGDFSMVGPRAEMPRYVGCYPTEIRKRVLSVKPGLLDLSTIEWIDGDRKSASTKSTRFPVRPMICASANDVDDLPSAGRVLTTAKDLGRPWLVANARLERIEK
jgi:lipopolysaccharide/colanic/teichoic acid biosynthesis glycosyltransferase